MADTKCSNCGLALCPGPSLSVGDSIWRSPKCYDAYHAEIDASFEAFLDRRVETDPVTGELRLAKVLP